eukprot:TRINITY_DN67252_c1_g1_i1.p1 TRINITY_DN67252_c1_g1~~TRINITY_DN67252_c1_g1_i1.p1  ORF type:complete len:185 (-),score=0.26 TRINITY_DN67252_c1_g1_i1:311-865(-)
MTKQGSSDLSQCVQSCQSKVTKPTEDGSSRAASVQPSAAARGNPIEAASQTSLACYCRASSPESRLAKILRAGCYSTLLKVVREQETPQLLKGATVNFHKGSTACPPHASLVVRRVVRRSVCSRDGPDHDIHHAQALSFAQAPAVVSIKLSVNLVDHVVSTNRSRQSEVLKAHQDEVVHPRRPL